MLSRLESRQATARAVLSIGSTPTRPHRPTSARAAGVGPIAPTATSDGSSISLLRTGANTGRLTLDGASVNVTFAAGAPTAVMFILYENSAEGTLGNPTGEHAFFFDNLRITVIPEPSSLAIMLLTGLTLIGARFRVWQ